MQKKQNGDIWIGEYDCSYNTHNGNYSPSGPLSL